MFKLIKLFGLIVFVTLGVTLPTQAAIIDSAIDSAKKTDNVKIIDSPVRAGSKSFEHSTNGGNRAELSFSKTDIGGTYWKGWSVFIPVDFKTNDKYTIIGQWAAYPSNRDKKFPCGAVGHRLDIRENGDIEVRFQPKNLDQKCIKYKLGVNANDIKGKWIDFGEHAKWAENNGFFKLWVGIEGQPMKQVVNHAGTTWWDDEDKAPYWKMGAYLGGNKGHQRIITDEYRLGDVNSSLEEVLPFRK